MPYAIALAGGKALGRCVLGSQDEKTVTIIRSEQALISHCSGLKVVMVTTASP